MAIAKKTRRQARADRVWDRLIQFYGTRVAEMFGPDVPEPWIEAIEDLTDEQIIYGLKAVLRESPDHPPALGRFQQSCANMPLQQRKEEGTLQEQLMEYSKLKLKERMRLGTLDYALAWTYVYREWWDASRPKGMERCAECTGIVIDLASGDRLGFRTSDMLADSDGHAKAMKMFRPGPPPTGEQMDIWRGTNDAMDRLTS